MSNYFSNNQIELLAKAKSEKKYIHLKNENESLKKVMNVNSLNKLILCTIVGIKKIFP